jgi:hypothetical protein
MATPTEARDRLRSTQARDASRRQLRDARVRVLNRDPVLRDGTTTRAHKTGVSSAVDPAAERRSDDWLANVRRALDNVADALARKSKDDEPAALEKALQEAIEKTATQYAASLVDKAPFGKTMLLALELSVAFADGLGDELDRINSELTKEYDDLIRGLPEEIGPDELAGYQRLRQYKATQVKQLEKLVAAGAERAGRKALDKLLGAAASKLKQAFGDVINQLAKQFVARNEVLAAFNGALSDVAGRIPAQRAQIERMFLSFAVKVWVDQLGDEKLSERLKPVLERSKSTLPIDVALLASVLEIATVEGYAAATQGTSLDPRVLAEVRDGMKWAALEQARKLVRRLTATGKAVDVSASGQIEADPGGIKLPRAQYELVMIEPGGAGPDVLRRWEARKYAFWGLLQGLRDALYVTGASSQRRIDRTAAERRHDVWLQLESALRQRLTHDRQKARTAWVAIVAEFEGVIPPDELVQLGTPDDFNLYPPKVSRHAPNGGLSDRPEDDE